MLAWWGLGRTAWIDLESQALQKRTQASEQSQSYRLWGVVPHGYVQKGLREIKPHHCKLDRGTYPAHPHNLDSRVSDSFSLSLAIQHAAGGFPGTP